MFLALFQRLHGDTTRSRVPRQRAKPWPRFAPRLESLEDRIVPSSSYTFQTIDNPAGVQGSQPNDINNAGEIVGLYADANGYLHSYRQVGSQYTTIDPPNESTTNPFSIATGINSKGDIVGGYRGSDGIQHGYKLSHGQYTTYDDPLAVNGTRTFGINAQGHIVGIWRDANHVTHGFLLVGGQYTTLDDPNAGTAAGQGTLPFEINASGQINGFYIDANNLHHAFLFSGGQFTTVDDPMGALGTEGSGINDPGLIVGGYYDSSGMTHGYIQNGSQYTTVDDPAGSNSYSDGINDPGQIVGNYLDASGLEHGFLATPNWDTAASGSGGTALAFSRSSGSIEAALFSTAGLLRNPAAVAPGVAESNQSTGVNTPNILIAYTAPAGAGSRTSPTIVTHTPRIAGSRCSELGVLTFNLAGAIDNHATGGEDLFT
jgi:uncharacterized membrane protein